MLPLILALLTIACSYATVGCLKLSTWFGQSPELCRPQILRSQRAALIFALCALLSALFFLREVAP